MGEKLSVHTLGLDVHKIKHDLSKYYKMFTNKQKAVLLKKYETVEDYVQIMYILRFVENLDYNEIAQKLGIRNINVYLAMYDFGWCYEGTFEENIEQHQRKLQELYKIKQKYFTAKMKEEDPNLYDLYERAKACRKDVYESLGFESPIHFANVMYALVEKEQLTRIEIAQMFNCLNRSMYYKLAKLGLNLDHSTAHEVKKKRKRHDYKRTNRAIRRTQMKSLLSEGLIGSNNENAVRSILEFIIQDYLDIDRFDIIVGINTRNIIPPLEVDIPLVIIDNLTGFVHKFAIEYNGYEFHKDEEKEKRKATALKEKGWVYFRIVEFGSTKKQREYGEIEQQIENICLKLKEIVNQ